MEELKTFKYWWEAIIWHPLDIADRILVVVGGVSGFLQKGSDPMTVNLFWQIPLGMILLFLVWRLVQMPVRIINDIRREKAGLPPLTLDGLSTRIVSIEKTIKNLQDIVEPKPSINQLAKYVVWNFKNFDYSMMGGITRAGVFVFEIENKSPVWIITTGNIKGEPIVLACRLVGIPMKVDCDGIAPYGKGDVRIIFPISEQFAKTLAFKPKGKPLYANFSEMYVEFETRENSHIYNLGYIPIPISDVDIPIKDWAVFQKIRKICEWEDSLGEDDYIN